MNIALISTYDSPVALGMRYVSAFLKRDGHQVRCIFLRSRARPGEQLPASLLDDIVDRCREVDLIGLSLMTNSFYRSREVTEALRQAALKAPILWGGTHPTVAPEECAEVADYVCVGEGERAVVEFAATLEAGRDPSKTRGFTFRKNGDLIQNPTYPLTDDLDDYPFPDYDLHDHWVANKGRLCQAKPELLRGVLRRYCMSSTRGCPFSCSFCNNATQLGIYRRAGDARHWVRKRSTASIIAEMEEITARYPSIEAVNLIDDLFLIRSEAEVAEFVDAYTSRANLPIEIDAFPNTVTDEKIRLLSKLPLQLISMGIQSGSANTLQNLYNRPTSPERVAEAIRIIASHGLRAEYHYLVANPFESEASMIETLRFAASYHRGPAKLRIFPLQFYPGSVMYDRALGEGVIDERPDAAYLGVYAGKKHIAKAAYLEIWLRVVLGLRGAGVPSRIVHRVVDLVTTKGFRKCFDRRWFAPACFMMYRVGHALHRNLIMKPFVRPIRKLRQRRARRLTAPHVGSPATVQSDT